MTAGNRLLVAGIALGLALSSASCGDEDEPATDDGAQTTVQEPAATGPAATEASPEADPAETGETGELSDEDEAAVTAAVRAYIRGLTRRDAKAVCALFEPGALPLSELPRRRGGCPASLAASLGFARPGGTPVWKRSVLGEVKGVSVGTDRARVTANVLHTFADRKFPSVENDVIYLDRSGDSWLLAQPSGTLYRAVGYPEPPLRSLSPPEEH